MHVILLKYFHAYEKTKVCFKCQCNISQSDSRLCDMFDPSHIYYAYIWLNNTYTLKKNGGGGIIYQCGH